MRASGRCDDEMRKVTIKTGILTHAEGSCLISCGNTQVICAASLGQRVPIFRRNTGLGWVTAEYAMLPRATNTRNRRESLDGRPSGRTFEIQRLIGRALRSCVHAASLGERQINIDCDVINADGGTRCAAITGAWIALRMAIDQLRENGTLTHDPLTHQIAAVSCGMVGGNAILDLEFSEDSEAETDANFVINDSGGLIEVQCSSERAPFTDESLAQMLALARTGTETLFDIQKAALAN